MEQQDPKNKSFVSQQEREREPDTKQPNPPHIEISHQRDYALLHVLRQLGCEFYTDGRREYTDERFKPQIESLLTDLASGKIEKSEFLRIIKDLADTRKAKQTPRISSPKILAERDELSRATQSSQHEVIQPYTFEPIQPEKVSQKEIKPEPHVIGEVSISPPGGNYNQLQKVVLSSKTPDVLIGYTLDGKEPTPQTAKHYTGEILIDQCLTLRARGFLPETDFGPVTTACYTFQPGEVTINPPAGSYNSPQTIFLSCPTPGAIIRYTLDGSEPTLESPEYTSQGILIDQSLIFQACAFVSGWNPGPVASAQYTIKPPQWQVLEPEDRSDPVDHEVSQSVELNNGWNLVGASVRGKLHAHRALWRDDSFAFGWQDQWTIFAVADGAGSARLSRIGARIACSTVVDRLKAYLDRFEVSTQSQDSKVPDQSDLLRIRAFLVQSVREAQGTLRKEAFDRKISIDDLSTTLLVAIYTPWKDRNLVAGIQVGDGFLALWSEPDGLTMMGIPDSGDFSGETRFLTTRNIEMEFDHRVLFTVKENVKGIVAMTDGVADDFFPFEQKLPDLFKELFDKVTPASEADLALQDWIKYEKKQSSDDRTLVLLYRTGKK